jgi:hypothetical protein
VIHPDAADAKLRSEKRNGKATDWSSVCTVLLVSIDLPSGSYR